MIVNKNKAMQESGGPLISQNVISKESHSDRGVVVSSDSEVSAKASRRRFTAEYKLGILTLAATCTEPGSLGALLRREGLYSSNLNTIEGRVIILERSFGPTLPRIESCTVVLCLANIKNIHGRL